MELIFQEKLSEYLQVKQWVESKGGTEVFCDEFIYENQYKYYHFKHEDYYHVLIRKIVNPYTVYIFRIDQGEVFDLPIFYHYLKTGKVENVLDDFDELMKWHLKE